MISNYRLIIALLLIVISYLLLSANLHADNSKDSTDNLTWKDRALKAEKELKETKLKLNKAIKYLEEYVEATPEIIEFKPTSIAIKIVDLKYSFLLPNPIDTNSWLNNLTVSIGWFSPRFQDLENFTFVNSRAIFTIGYEFYGFKIFTSYDFVDNWKFGFEANLISIGAFIYNKVKK